MDIQQKKNDRINTGQDVARYLIYFSRVMNKKFSDKEINIVNISGLRLYRKHKKTCDNILILQDKYNIDLVAYIKFFVSKYRLIDGNVDKLININNIVWYTNDLEIKTKYHRVYSYVMKSVKNIVNSCIKEDFTSINEYLKHLIQHNLLAGKYLSGEISEYYLAGISNFKKILLKMDFMNQNTLKEIAEKQDKLVSDMQDAFMYVKHQPISIISFTNNLFNKQKQQLIINN